MTSQTAEKIVLTNANVITVDDAVPPADTVAVSGDRISFVGKFADLPASFKDGARVVDLKHATLVPGFNDNHAHTMIAGIVFGEPMLRHMTAAQVAAVVREHAAKRKPGETIFGSSWDYPTCPAPHKSILDEAAPRNPVFLVQYSGHAAWVNSTMLAKLKITRDTPDPKGGQIVRDANGEPTGVLRDTAMGYASQGRRFVEALLVPAKHEAALATALDAYRKAGVTSVQDNTWEPLTVRRLNIMRREGRLTCRFTCWPFGHNILTRHLLDMSHFDGLWIRKGPAKYLADGAFSTRTAYLHEPYIDEPGNSGEPRFTSAELDAIVMKAARERRQVAIHAIGDLAAKEILDAVEKAQTKYPWTRELRIRIEHAQLLDRADIRRMKTLGVLGAAQPLALCDPAKDIRLLGVERSLKAYPYKSMIAEGVETSFGSDVPAEVDFAPLLGIHYAVNRNGLDGKGPIIAPDERVTAFEALRCYTMGSAYAEFMEREKGSLTPGKLADMVVLGDDITKVAPEKIKDVEVVATMVGGRVVWGKDTNIQKL